MNDYKQETIGFKKLLDQLPYLSEREKIIACSMYLIATDDIKTEIKDFYEEQIKQHKLLLEERDQRIEAARQKLNEEIKGADN